MLPELRVTEVVGVVHTATTGYIWQDVPGVPDPKKNDV